MVGASLSSAGLATTLGYLHHDPSGSTDSGKTSAFLKPDLIAEATG